MLLSKNIFIFAPCFFVELKMPSINFATGIKINPAALRITLVASFISLKFSFPTVKYHAKKPSSSAKYMYPLGIPKFTLSKNAKLKNPAQMQNKKSLAIITKSFFGKKSPNPLNTSQQPPSTTPTANASAKIDHWSPIISFVYIISVFFLKIPLCVKERRNTPPNLFFLPPKACRFPQKKPSL